MPADASGAHSSCCGAERASSPPASATPGATPNATYRNHGDRAEAVEIVFDPSVISYRDLLEFFFQIHDPSTRDRQGNDIGRSYRSAIFTTNDEQKRVALDTIADVDASGLWPGKVVTEVEPAGAFWEAEEEHQDYLEGYPNGSPATTCVRDGSSRTARSSPPSSTRARRTSVLLALRFAAEGRQSSSSSPLVPQFTSTNVTCWPHRLAVGADQRDRGVERLAVVDGNS